MKQDLAFIAGEFFDTPISKEQEYLLKYFKTDIQVAFLRYYLIFETWRGFAYHTGIRCDSGRYLRRQEIKFRKLVTAHQQAKSTMDLALLAKIESGQYLEAFDFSKPK